MGTLSNREQGIGTKWIQCRPWGAQHAPAPGPKSARLGVGFLAAGFSAGCVCGRECVRGRACVAGQVAAGPEG